MLIYFQGQLLLSLVQCLFQVTRQQEQRDDHAMDEDQDEAEAALRTEIEDMMDSFNSRMLKAELEDFELVRGLN